MRQIERFLVTNSAGVMFALDAIQREQFRLVKAGELDDDTARWSESILAQLQDALTPEERNHWAERFAGRNVW